MLSKEDLLKEKILKKSQSIGFTAFGIAKSHSSKHQNYLYQWLENGYSASMDWMRGHLEKRIDPSQLVPGAKTVLVVADVYRKKNDKGGKHIARYAQGPDYHRILKNRLHLLFDYIKEIVPSVTGRVFVDSAPVLENYWAEQAGVGWIGKNTLTITKPAGSFVFLGSIISDLELPSDSPSLNHCGTCTACLDACPTNAFPKPYVLDANKCVSYLTIEHRGGFNSEEEKNIGEHVYGCDICLEVCPWNHKTENAYSDIYGSLPVAVDDLKEIAVSSQKDFEKKYGDSAITRTRFEGFKRNQEAVLKNKKKIRKQ